MRKEEMNERELGVFSNINSFCQALDILEQLTPKMPFDTYARDYLENVRSHLEIELQKLCQKPTFTP